jgi:hypothetical protein
MKLVKFFIYSAGGILLAATLIRFVIAAGGAQALTLPEPVLGFPLRYEVMMVGGIELIVALMCLFGKQIDLQIGWLAWLSTYLVVYRIILLWLHFHPQATCIGSLTDPLHLSRGITGAVTVLIPFYLVFGTYASAAWLWLAKGGRAALRAARLPLTGSLKMVCAACGGHIAFPIKNLGKQTACPHCKTGVTLREPGNLKMSCFFCKEHIEYPAHALGTKIKCPHCEQDITLKEPSMT